MYHRLTRRPLLLVDVQRLDDALEQPQLVVAVEDLKSCGRLASVRWARKTMRRAVEGAGSTCRPGWCRSDVDTVAHLAAALLVKVTAIIEYGEQLSTDSSRAMRCTSTWSCRRARPGQNQQLLRGAATASRCFSFQAVERDRRRP